MAWVPEPIRLESIDPVRGSTGTSLEITGYGRGFRPQTTVEFRNTAGDTLNVTAWKVSSPQRFSATVDTGKAASAYSVIVTNPPSDATSPADDMYTLTDGLVIES